MDRVADRLAAQLVEIEAGLVHILGLRRHVQRIEPDEQATTQIATDAAFVSPLPEALQRTVAEGRDHNGQLGRGRMAVKSDFTS